MRSKALEKVFNGNKHGSMRATH